MERERCAAADLRVYARGQGLVWQGASLVALEQGKAVAFGAEAAQLAEKRPQEVGLVSPLRQGRIADYTAAVPLFAHLLRRGRKGPPLPRPAVALCVQGELTEVEKIALQDAVTQAGGGKVMLVPGPAEEFARSPLPGKFRLAIHIGKEEPEEYFTEAVARAVRDARQAGVSLARLAELLRREAEELGPAR